MQAKNRYVNYVKKSKVTNVKKALLVIFVSILNITVYNTCSD